jgi:ankyrin repeat protein
MLTRSQKRAAPSPEAPKTGKKLKKLPPPIYLHAKSCQGLQEDVDKMESKLENDGNLLSKINKNGITPIYSAIRSGHIKCVRFILDKGADLSAEYSKLLRTLFIKCKMSNHGIKQTAAYLEIMTLILQSNTNRHWDNKVSSTILVKAVVLSDYNLVELLLLHGVNPNEQVCWRLLTVRFCRSLFKNNDMSDVNLKVYKLLCKYGFRLECRALSYCTNVCRSKMLKFVFLHHGRAALTLGELIHDNNNLNNNILLNITAGYSKIKLKEILKKINVALKFGCNIWHQPGDIFHFRILRGDGVNGITKSVVEAEINKMNSAPLSLKCLSRIAVMHAMGSNFVYNYNKLEIPAELITFLEFPDV